MTENSHDPLRPVTLADFTGQPRVSQELDVILRAAQSRDELAPHLLFCGPPGLGKTTLAGIVANEMGMPLLTTSGPTLEKAGDLVSLLSTITSPTVVFIDEIHRMPKLVEETLYSAMEDMRIDVMVGDRAVSLPLSPFTLVGATTQIGMLSGPLRDRFGHVARLKPYSVDTLAAILNRSAGLLEETLTGEAAEHIARVSRGTPRIGNHLLRRVRDYAHTRETSRTVLDEATAAEALDLFGVDNLGLDPTDRDILHALCVQFNGGPVGVATLATAVGEAPVTLSEAHEPYLMRAGLLARTLRGRVATATAYLHLGLPVPATVLTDVPADEALFGDENVS